MKLVMKADDGKEIFYISENNYDVGYVEEIPDTLIVDVSKIPLKYKNYLEKIIEENINIELKKKGKEFLLITPDIYFMFDEGLYDIVYGELEVKNEFPLAIGCEIKINGENKWSSFFTGEMKQNAN